MKTKLIFLTLIAPFFVSSQLSAKTGNVNVIMKTYDTNYDNRLSPQELPPMMRLQFKNFDTNRDGYISRQEFINSTNANQNRYRNNFNYYDKNRDGIISKHEMAGKERKRFYNIDQNGDGVLTRKEFRKNPYLGVTVKSSQKTSMDKSRRFFNHYDRNHNGFISKNEMSAKLKQNFPHYDINNDGMLNLKEYRLLFAGKLPAKKYHKPGSFNYLDSNADGMLSKKELSRSSKLHFYEFDLDGNNFISRTEFKTVKREQNQMNNVQREENWHEKQNIQNNSNDGSFDYNNDDGKNSAYY